MSSIRFTVMFFLLFMDCGLLIKAEATCGIEDYSPCTCESLRVGDSNYVSCLNKTVLQVMDVFNRTHTKDVTEVRISFAEAAKDNIIPDNFLADKTTSHIYIDCVTSIGKISKDSFNLSRPITERIELKNCNLTESDLSFFDDFIALGFLSLEKFSEMGKLFATFPSHLPLITALKFVQCSGWNTLMNAPSPVVGNLKIQRLDVIQSIGMNDDAMNLVMEWAVQSFNSTLRNLYIHSINLTKIPDQIEFFGQMETLDIKNNKFPLIRTRTLKYNSTILTLLDLSNCGIKEIEPKAFEGKFENILIDLGFNRMTRLDSSVFEEILLEGGMIDVTKNPLDCNEDPCHLAWIFNQNMLKSIDNAECSNGTLLKDLQPEFFIDCYMVSTSETNTPSWGKVTTSESPEYTITVSKWSGSDSTSANQPQQLFTTKNFPATDRSTPEEGFSLLSSTIYTQESKVYQTSLAVTSSPDEIPTSDGAMNFFLYWMFPFTSVLLNYLSV